MRDYDQKQRLLIWGLGWALPALLMMGHLAHHVQNPDGMELLMTATQGGNLHGPGYPLQNWLNRMWLILIPGNHAVFELSLFNFLLHMASLALLIRLFIQQKLHPCAILVGSYFFTFNASIWYLAVQPEKYALLNLLTFALWLLTLQGRTPHPFLLGATLGLAFSHHPFVILSLPFVALLIIRQRPSLSWLLRSGLTCACVTLSLYGSLYFLKGDGVWPDWGLIQSHQDWMDLILRKDFKGVQIAGEKFHPDLWAGSFAVDDYKRIYFIFGLLPFLGFYGLFKNRQKKLLVALLTSLALGLVLLIPARYPGAIGSYAYMERYALAVYLPLIPAAAYGFEWIMSYSGRLRRLFLFFPLLLAFHLVHGSWYRADASQDNTLNIFLQGVALLVEDQNIYLAGTDLEVFGGLPQAEGVTRFPLVTGYSWSVKRQYPLADGRIPALINKGVNGVADWSEREKLTVVSTHQSQLEAFSKRPSQIYGLIYRAGPNIEPGVTWDSILAAYKLCPLVSQLNELPDEGHFYGKHLMDWFGNAYQAALKYFKNINDQTGAEMSFRLASSLYINSNKHHSPVILCQDFRRHVEKNYLNSPR